MLALIPSNVSKAVEPTKYTVTFETNGGSKVDSVQVEEMKTLTLPNAPTKEGFVFAGWCIDEECQYDFWTSDPITADKTLYAKWVTSDKVIKTLNLTMTKPEIGDNINSETKIVVTPESGANYEIYVGYFITSFPSKGEGYDEAYEGKFENDKDYYFEFEYFAKEGYIFDKDLTIKLNGSTVDFELNGWGMGFVKVNIPSESSNENNEDKQKEETKKESTVVAEDTDNEEEVAAAEGVGALVDEILAGKEVEGIDEETATKIIAAKTEGKAVKVEVENKQVEAEEVKEDAEKIEELIGEKASIGVLFDVNVLAKADGTTLGKVTKLGNKVRLALAIPEDLQAVPSGYTRTFGVATVHNGVASEVDSEVDGDKIYTFADRFSTYAITYTDTKETSNPKTGDTIALSVAIVMASIAGAVEVFRKLK